MPSDSPRAHEALLTSLQERAKELNCLYHIEEVLRTDSGSMEDIFQKTIEAIPPGWQSPEICQLVLTHGDRTFRSAAFERTAWMLRAEITVQEVSVGALEIYYLEDIKRVMSSGEIGNIVGIGEGCFEALDDLAEIDGHTAARIRVSLEEALACIR